MKPRRTSILALNGGSSSVRFAIFDGGAPWQSRLRGKIDRLGQKGAVLLVDGESGARPIEQLSPADRRAPVDFLLKWLDAQPAFASVGAVGHRVVHGLTRSAPARVTPGLLAELRRVIPFDPEHLPRELALIEAIRRRHRGLPQVVCFDTAFHRTMPRVARLLPIPRRYWQQGVQRYGFHGLSYAFVLQALTDVDRTAKRGRVILAHLGNGASLAAIHQGKSIDTSMGLTPASGLVMGSRSGDLDPGIAGFLARTDRMSPAQFQHMVNHESGLFGVSGLTSDVRELLAREGRNTGAAEAVELFCYQAKKWIGAYAAVLGGLDTLVFTGGIGENSAVIRARICAGLEFLGLRLDRKRNAANAALVSGNGSRVKVRVIPTDEEVMIARLTARTLAGVHA